MITPEKPGIAAAPPVSTLERLEEAGLRVAERRYEPSRTIFMAGDPADKLYLLVEGIVRVCKDYGDYSQATVALLKDGRGFGEFDLSGGGRQRASAQAMTECRVASIRTGDIKLSVERQPKLAVELFSVFSEKLRHSEQTMGILLCREVAARLASLIPMLAEKFGEHGEDGDEFTVPFTQSELAEMVACSREAVSKALGELRRGGYIGRIQSVEVGEREAAIDLTMSTEYGKAIPQLTQAVRDNVVKSVERMTGLKVTEVNATVSDIYFPDEGQNRELPSASRES